MRLPSGLPTWAGRYLGIPFVSGGRTRDGLDCYGLVRLVFRERFGLELADLATVHLEAGRDRFRVALKQSAGAWVRLPADAARLGDVVLVEGGAQHVGLALGCGAMLHAAEGVESSIVRTDRKPWSALLTGALRHREMLP